MDTKPLRELTIDEAEMFLKLQKITDKQADDLFKKLIDQDGGWVLKAIEKRFNVLEKNVDKKIMVMILFLGDGIIGKCVKFVDDIISWGNKFNHSTITWDQYTKDIYPVGIPIF